MDDDFSIESICALSTGLSESNISTEIESVENYDNDSLAYEITSMETFIDNIELCGQISKLNDIEKIKMAKRINDNYGYYNRSLEDYCEKIIRSIEDGEEEKKSEDDNKTEEKPNIFKRFFSMIGKFFKKIFDAIKKVIGAIIDKITELIANVIPDDLKKNMDKLLNSVKVFKEQLKIIEPKHDELTKYIEKMASIEVQKNANDTFNEFHLLCKITSLFYQCLYKASNKLIGYIKSYYKDVRHEMNKHGIVWYFSPTNDHISNIGKDFSKILNQMIVFAKRAINSPDININDNEYNAIIKAYSFFFGNIILRKVDTNHAKELLKQLEEYKEEKIDEFINNVFCITPHFEKD